MYKPKYFVPSEFECHGEHCCNHANPPMNERLLMVLDRIREKVGRPVNVDCAYRCPVHNAEVGGVPNSFHIQCMAADIWVAGMSVDELAKVAEECGADGIGRYFDKNFVHVDVRGYRARWQE
jgi:uncharacterized protein YcbK (DUF882 family)